MPEEKRTDCRQLWLCRHQPPWDPRGGPFPTPCSCRASGKRIKLKLAAKAGEKKTNPKRNKSKTYKQRGNTCTPPKPQSSPSQGFPASLEQGVSTGRGDGHSPPRGQTPVPHQGGRAASPLLTLLGSAGRASSWTLGSRHERQPGASGGSCWLPRGGSPTSLFLSEKCNHFLTWALGERKAARRPPCPCLRARPLRHRRTWMSHRPRDAPGSPRCSAGCGQQLPTGAPGKDAARGAKGKEPHPLPLAAGGLLATPTPVPDAFQGGQMQQGGPARRCWPAAGDGCDRSPPRAR